MGERSHVVVTGLMGSGKTAVGREVARRLEMPFSDSDTAIEAVTGRTGKEIAEEEGVAALHALEAQHLLDAVSGRPAVIAAAASVLDDAECRRTLGSVCTVFLDVAVVVLSGRIGGAPHRRTLRDPERELLSMRMRRREAAVAAGAIVIDVGDRSVAAVAAEVTGACAGHG